MTLDEDGDRLEPRHLKKERGGKEANLSGGKGPCPLGLGSRRQKLRAKACLLLSGVSIEE